MKSTLGFVLFWVGMLVLSFGCGGSASVVGTWMFDSNSTIKAIQEEQMAGLTEDQKKQMNDNPMVQSRLGMFDQMQMEMELKADGTCTHIATIHGKTDSTTGTWRIEGDTVVITMLTMNDVNPSEETQRFTFEDDVLKMIVDEKAKTMGSAAFYFVRK